MFFTLKWTTAGGYTHGTMPTLKRQTWTIIVTVSHEQSLKLIKKRLIFGQKVCYP